MASSGRATPGLYGEGTGSSPRSAPSRTATTPGIAAASLRSMPVIVPWATGERT